MQRGTRRNGRTSCPLRKALAMLFRGERSKRISYAFAVTERKENRTLREKGVRTSYIIRSSSYGAPARTQVDSIMPQYILFILPKNGVIAFLLPRRSIFYSFSVSRCQELPFHTPFILSAFFSGFVTSLLLKNPVLDAHFQPLVISNST